MIEYDRVELVPADSRFFDDGADVQPRDVADTSRPDQSTLARELAYAQRAAEYEALLELEYRAIRWGPMSSRLHPEHAVRLTNRTATVVYDATLDRQLLKIYLDDGWPGIRAVEEALRVSSAARATLHPWAIAEAFLRFTRNLLVLAIRDALLTIERKSADRLVLELSLSARMVNESWGALDIRVNGAGDSEAVITDEPSPSWDTPVQRRRSRYRLGDTKRAAKLFDLVGRAVQARADIAAQIAKRRQLRDLVDLAKEDMSGEPPGDVTEQLAEVEAWLAAKDAAVRPLYQDIYNECPLVLLAVPLLTVPLSRAAMEQTVGECLAHLHGESERIAGAYADRTGKVAGLVPGDQPGRSPELLFDADFAPEYVVANAVITGSQSDPGMLALLSVSLLNRLVEERQVEFDTFEYMVLMHYVTALQTGLLAAQEADRDIAGVVAQVGALLSLALWAVPAGRAATGVAALLGVSMISYQTSSVVHQLAMLDRRLDSQLPELDRQSAAQLVALSELAQQRPAFLTEVTEAVVWEIGLIVAAGAGEMYKHLLHLRGVSMDVETLTGA